MVKTIQAGLRKALVANGDMSYALYKHELEEYIDYWKAGMRQDRDEFLFVLTENRGKVAMLLITNQDELFINELAREQLQLRWKSKGVYANNMKLMIPLMAEQLQAGELAVTGVKTVPTPL